MLVLALGTGALAADVKVGGCIAYNLENPGNSCEPIHYLDWNIRFESALSEQTSAKIQMNIAMFSEFELEWLTVSTAQIKTKLAGLGTLGFGVNPDFGTSPFEAVDSVLFAGESMRFNGVWGLTNYTPAVAFATEKVGVLAGQIYADLYDPDAQDDDGQIAAEITYDLPALEGASVGVALSKWESE
ncbi:MAG: hypothetical protein ACM3UP_00300 [Methanocella sp.]